MGLWHVGESRRRSRHLLICSIVAALASVLGDLTEICLSVKQELRTAVI